MLNREIETDKNKLEKNSIREIIEYKDDTPINKDNQWLWYEQRGLDLKSQTRNNAIDICSFGWISVAIPDNTTTPLVNADYASKIQIWPYKRDDNLNWIMIPSTWIYKLEVDVLRDGNNTWARRVLVYKNWSQLWSKFIIRWMSASDTTVYRMWMTSTVELSSWDLIWLAVIQNSGWVLSILDWELTIRKP